jgi:hypothetical protein
MTLSIRRNRAVLAIGMALAVSLCALAPSQASAAPDAWCASWNSSYNTAFQSYVLQEGVGLVGWRSAHNLRIRDRCNHGAITGTVSIYDANVKYKRGRVVPQIRYRVNGGAWTSAFVHLRLGYTSGGWSVYSVFTDNNIGLVRTWNISHIKVGSYLVFNGVGSSGRRVECARNAGCSTALGL